MIIYTRRARNVVRAARNNAENEIEMEYCSGPLLNARKETSVKLAGITCLHRSTALFDARESELVATPRESRIRVEQFA